jgi:hypothetical protein
MLTTLLIITILLGWIALIQMSDIQDLKAEAAMIRYKLEELEAQSARERESIATMQMTANRALGRLEDRMGTRSPTDEISFDD